MNHTAQVSADDAFHQRLARFNVARVALSTPAADWRSSLLSGLQHQLEEGDYIESLRADVAPLMRLFPPSSPGDFVTSFEALALQGPGQQHPLFDWLADDATLAEIGWFLTQEAAGEAGFEDLLAYTQVKLPTQPKLECARNYWDEMGHGKESAMHGQMLDRIVQELGLTPAIETTVWESLALSNTMMALALNRRYVYQSIGALGVIELTAPQRVSKVSAGMRRLGLTGRQRAYFDLHAALDVSHAKAWLREVIRPLAERDPDCTPFIAEGALMRLLCGKRCFDRYRAALMPQADQPGTSDIDQAMAASC